MADPVDMDILRSALAEEAPGLSQAVRDRLANRVLNTGFRTRRRTMASLRQLGSDLVAARARAEAAEAKLAQVAAALDGPDPVAAAKAVLSA